MKILLLSLILTGIISGIMFYLDREFSESFKNCEICGADENLIEVGYSCASDIPWYQCTKCINLAKNKKTKLRSSRTYTQRFPRAVRN